MVTQSKPKAWAQAIAKPAKEFDSTPLPIISGEVPANLRGTLYRNGPARLSRGGERVGHWFDGDGAILGIYFEDDGVRGIYRYVKTQGYLDEQKEGSFIYPNYGMTAKGAFWNNWFKPVKNAANTSVLALPDRLLALWEGGKPHALDLDNLTTLGLDDLGGLTDKQSFSAHPKIDGDTGEIFNYGVSPGKSTVLNLYRCDRNGKLQQQNSHTLSGLLPIIHDFCLAGKYIVFLTSPVRANLAPIILGQKSYSDSMEWKPELGTEILIFDRDSLSLVSRDLADPWFQWHFTNGYVNQQGNIVTEFVRYENFDTNQYLKEVASGETQTRAKGTLWELTIDPQTAKVIDNQQVLDLQAEFPLVAPQDVGKPWRYTYLNVHPPSVVRKELFNAIARFDRETKSIDIADMGEDCYPSEPILVPNPDNLQQSWLLTVVYDSNTDLSEVRIYQSDRLSDDPICRLALPSVIPPGFHGTWKQS